MIRRISHSMLSISARRRVLLAVSRHVKEGAAVRPAQKLNSSLSNHSTCCFSVTASQQTDSKTNTTRESLIGNSGSSSTTAGSNDFDNATGPHAVEIEAVASGSRGDVPLKVDKRISDSASVYQDALRFFNDISQYSPETVGSVAESHLIAMSIEQYRYFQHSPGILAISILEETTKILQGQTKKDARKLEIAISLLLANLHRLTLRVLLHELIHKTKTNRVGGIHLRHKEKHDQLRNEAIMRAAHVFLKLLENHPPSSDNLKANKKIYNFAFNLVIRIMTYENEPWSNRRYKVSKHGKETIQTVIHAMQKLWDDPSYNLEMDAGTLNAMLKVLISQGQHTKAAAMLGDAIALNEKNTNELSYLLVIVGCANKDPELVREWLGKWKGKARSDSSSSSYRISGRQAELVVTVLHELAQCETNRETAGQCAEEVLDWTRLLESYSACGTIILRGIIDVVDAMTKVWIHAGVISRAEEWVEVGITFRAASPSHFYRLLHAYATNEKNTYDARLERAEQIMAKMKEFIKVDNPPWPKRSLARVYNEMMRICSLTAHKDVALSKAKPWLQEMNDMQLDTEVAMSILQQLPRKA